MADISYEIGHLFQLAFGRNLPVYLPKPVQVELSQNKGINYSGVQVVEAQEAERLSHLGTPILFPIKFKAGTYKAYNAFGESTDKTFANDYELPATTICQFNRAKNVVRTNVLGSSGTVKEIYGFDDWRINIRGLCLWDGQTTAQDQYQALLQWENLADAIDVFGDMFTELEIRRLVIEEISFKQLQATPDVIPFEIRAIADRDLKLVINKNNRS